jgi:hypothetical protein
MRGGKLTTSLEIRQMSSGNRHSLSWHWKKCSLTEWREYKVEPQFVS